MDSVRTFLSEPIPLHMKRWYFALGVTPLILFVFQVITGILLTFYYVPSPEMAYESVRHLTQDVPMGFWVRGLHKWGSNLMVITIFLHMIRVFFTRAYRRPRELNWLLGVGLLLTVLALCFTGYSLIYDQLSYWATIVGTNLIREVPLVGNFLLFFIRGGEEVTANTLIRFFSFHVGFLPTLLIFLLVLHILLMRLHGVAELEGHEGEGYYPLYPDHLLTGICIALFVLTFASVLTVLFPPPLGEPADPTSTPLHIKPEWYFYPIFGYLKLVPLRLGVYTLVAFFLIFAFWPFIDEVIQRRFPKAKISYILGGATALLVLFFTIWETIVY